MPESINLEENEEEFVEYTADEAYHHLNKIQGHLEVLLMGEKEKFCTACLYKHLDNVSGRECVSAKCPSLEVWMKLADWGTKNKNKILELLKEEKALTKDEALKLVEETRDFRKEMEKILVASGKSLGKHLGNPGNNHLGGE